jgi:PPM family protein phosphatase
MPLPLSKTFVESAGLTNIGRRRKINQDALLLDDQLGLYVVADGMGGHKAGEIASRIVVESLGDSMGNPAYDSDMMHPDDSFSPEANRLLSAIQNANRNVFRSSRENNEYKGMGSTVSVVYLQDNSIIGANVGDSPIYLIHRKQIEEISVPHTLAAEQAATGTNGITQPLHSLSHILTRAMGTHDSVDVHLCEIQRFKGDILVIGSDGLSNKVSREEISKAAQTLPPAEACKHLVSMANQRGGEDNITVIVIKIGHVASRLNSVVKLLMRFVGKVFPVFPKKRRTV